MTPLPGKNGDRFVIDDPWPTRAERERSISEFLSGLPRPKPLSTRTAALSSAAAPPPKRFRLPVIDMRD